MNTNQLELKAYARKTDPDTSHEAAHEMSGPKVGALEASVLAAIKDSPTGLTNSEIVDVTGLNWNTTSPRLRPLVRKNLICDSGQRRPGRSNRKQIVWRAV